MTKFTSPKPLVVTSNDSAYTTGPAAEPCNSLTRSPTGNSLTGVPLGWRMIA
jgi:hypothetical protein